MALYPGKQRLIQNGEGDAPVKSLQGGERIFSREDTEILMKMASNATTDAQLSELGRFLFEVLAEQDANQPEYTSEYAEGGKVSEPPLKKLYNSQANDPDKFNEQKQFMNDWYSNPATQQRLAANATELGQRTKNGEKISRPVLDRIREEKIFYAPNKEDQGAFAQGLSSTITGSKKQQAELADNLQNVSYGANFSHVQSSFIRNRSETPEKEKSTAVHEITHATGMDEYLNPLIHKKWGKTPSDYLNNSEVYPRIMQIRHDFGLQPGQEVDPATMENIFKKITSDKTEDSLFKYYSKEQVQEMLNILAAKDQPNNKIQYAKKGGRIAGKPLLNKPKLK